MSQEVVVSDTDSQEYRALVEDCQSVITERVYVSRLELVIGYGEVGQRIFNDPLYHKHQKGNQSFVQQLFRDIGIHHSTGYACLQFYEKFIYGKYEDVSTAMETLFPEDGKNISWNKIKTRYLTAEKPECEHDWEQVWRCQDCKKIENAAEHRPQQKIGEQNSQRKTG